MASGLGDPDFPALVSYPRTGSHWLRMAMEAYTGMASYPVVFNPGAVTKPGYTFTHTHDLGLTFRPEGKVVYLWREDALSVIYSRLVYEKWRPTAPMVEYLRSEYIRHLRHWVNHPNILCVTYEEMQEDLHTVLGTVARYLRVRGNQKRVPKLSHEAIASSIADKRAVMWGDLYEAGRVKFKEQYGYLFEEKHGEA